MPRLSLAKLSERGFLKQIFNGFNCVPSGRRVVEKRDETVDNRNIFHKMGEGPKMILEKRLRC